jgi:hypothetical protein
MSKLNDQINDLLPKLIYCTKKYLMILGLNRDGSAKFIPTKVKPIKYEFAHKNRYKEKRKYCIKTYDRMFQNEFRGKKAVTNPSVTTMVNLALFVVIVTKR